MTSMPKPHSGASISDILAQVKRMVAPLLAFSIVINLMTLVMPIYMLQIYDRVLTSRNLSTLLLLTMVAFALLAVGSLLTHYRSRIASRLGMQLSQQLAQPVFDLLIKISLDTKPSKRQPVQDLDKVRDFFAGGNLIRLFDIPWTPIFLFVIFLLHPLIGMVAFFAACALLVVDWIADRRHGGHGQLFAQAKAKADGFLGASLQRAAEIWSMGMSRGVGARWYRQQAKALAEQSNSGDVKSGHDAIRRFIAQGAQMAMLGMGAYLAVLEEITAGTIVAGSIICARALSPINGAVRSWRQYGEFRCALVDLETGMEQDKAPAQPRSHLSHESQLLVQNLTIDPGETLKPTIKLLDFSMKPGETMSIVGPSGTGKSLLAKTLVGTRRPVEGTVSINGIDLYHAPPDRIGRMIGYVPEKMLLLDGTFGENIGRFGESLSVELDRALDRAGLFDRLALLPDGYDTPITVAARYLSPIQLRFVMLARALYRDPAILVLDHIDSGLDKPSLEVLSNVVQTCQALGQIVIWITDRATVVQQLDHVMILSKRGVETLCPVHRLVDMAAVS